MKKVIIALGSIFSHIFIFLGELVLFIVDSISHTFRWGIANKKYFIKQFYETGNRSLSVVLTTGLFTGLVLAVDIYAQFKRVELETMMGAVVGISMVKELGPVLVGLMFAGRVGAQITAELGSMKVSQQIDAFESLALDKFKFLVVPRITSCTIASPILTILADFIGLFGATLLACYIYRVPEHFYFLHLREWVTTWDISAGLIKSAIFGFLIATTCCNIGLKVEGGAEAVGSAVTKAVVISCIIVLISDFILALIL